MGRFTRPMLAAGIVIAILFMSVLVERGQAGTMQQTVPTVGPTATNTSNPTSTQGVFVPTNTTQPGATNPAVLQPTSTLSANATQAPAEQTAVATDVGAQPTATEVGIGTPTATASSIVEITPTQTGTDPAPEGWLKSLYFLVCGLGVVAAIAIIILLAIRKAAKNTAPPSPPGPTG